MKFGNAATVNASNMPADPSEALNQMPLRMLESFFPGLSVLSRFLVSYFGLDVTTILSTSVFIVALISSCRFLYRNVTNFVNKWLTCKIVITSSDRLYDQVMDYVSRNILNDSSRALMAKSAGSNWDISQQRHTTMRQMMMGGSSNTASQTNASGEFDWNPAPMYAPSIGTHRFWHGGRFFMFERQNQTTTDGNNGIMERELITITSFGRSPRPIKQLLRDCQTLALEQKRSMTTIRPSTGNGWQRALTRPSRPMDTVYMNEGVKEELLEDVHDFLSPMQPRYYARRGIPYRRGYLFFGPPGTGKTSLTLALAGSLGLELHVLSLMESGLTEQRLMNQFQNLPPRCIILIEDVDAAGLHRRNLEENKKEDKEKEKPKEEKEEEKAPNAPKMQKRKFGQQTIYVSEPDKLSLSGLLNVIDGVASQEGRILIMTTNSPESLDEALVRPGRVDMQVHFGNLTKANAKSIFLRMYSDDKFELPSEMPTANGHAGTEKIVPLSATKSQSELESLANDFAEAIPDLKMTPAEVQGFLLTRRKSPQTAIADVSSWVDSVLEAKAEGRNILGDEKRPKPMAQANGDVQAVPE